jgi:hypothetical protein
MPRFLTGVADRGACIYGALALNSTGSGENCF